MESGNLQTKLKLLFETITKPDYVLNNYYADSLLNKLKSNEPEITHLMKLPLLSDLVLNSLQYIETAHLSVKVFIIRLLAIISQNELHFTKIFANHGDKMSKAFAIISDSKTMPSTRVAYLEVALALSTHNSGAAWLLETKAWMAIFNLCHNQQTVFVLRQTYKFTSDFLWKLSDMEEEDSVILILDYILEPIMKNPYQTIKSLSKEEEIELTKKFEPALHLMLAILSHNTKFQQPNILIKLLVTNYKLNVHLFSILTLTHREEIMHMLAKIAFLLMFAKVFLTKSMSSTQFEKCDFIDMTVTYFNTLQFFVKRRLVVPLMDYCNTCCILWSEIWSKSQGPTFEKNGRTFELQSQLQFILLVPVLVYIKADCKTFCRSNANDSLNQYITKLLSSSCEHTARAAYSVRNLMFESDALALATHCVKRLSCLKNHLNNAGANLIFQALFYVLKNYMPQCENGVLVEEDDLEEGTEKMLVMTYVMETVYMLVKDHNINWQESLETICLYSLVFSILKRKNLSCKFVVAALNLIKVTVQKFLPPNLSLLVASTPDSSLHDLGKLIYSKIHDPNWEIRDSALELLLVCTEISFIKYTPFQEQIIENNLIVVATTIALNDSEFYVQASALKCLGAASRISGIWGPLCQHHPDIQEKLISQLCKNPEGIVRKEVVGVLCEMYQNLKLQPVFKEILYQHMVSAAICDFHWEVQIGALRFWRIVINTLLADKGMLDGTFPPVTFSKETRKIVTLNETEVQRRLGRTLEDLANIGCLTVLVKLLDEDIDVEIMESSLNISLDLQRMLKQYNINDMPPTPVSNSSLTDNLDEVTEDNLKDANTNGDISEVVTTKSDSIIESILNANDINLLSNIYESHMRLQGENSTEENACQPKIKLQKYVSPLLFLRCLGKRDFKMLIEEKRRWRDGIRSTSSLLDDILGIYECLDDVNDLDCY